MSTLGREFDQAHITLSEEISRPYPLVRVAVAAFVLAKDFLNQGENLLTLNGGGGTEAATG